jgi:hypothetical protein
MSTVEMSANGVNHLLRLAIGEPFTCLMPSERLRSVNTALHVPHEKLGCHIDRAAARVVTHAISPGAAHDRSCVAAAQSTLFQKAFQRTKHGIQRASPNVDGSHRSNETELSHRWRERAWIEMEVSS